MLITAKSGVSLNQLKEREIKGAKYIELQLFEEDVKSEENIRKTIENIKNSNLSIEAICIPVDRKFAIEGLTTNKGFKIIQNTCNLAEKISRIMKKTIHVILYQELNLRQLKEWEMYSLILGKLNFILKKHKNITINLRNVAMSDEYYSFQNIELCKELRNDLKTKRIGAVLDTCHAIHTVMFIQCLKGINPHKRTNLHKNIVLRDYFVRYKGYANVIYLSNARGFGYDDSHVNFDTKEEKKLLKKILEYIDEIDFQGILTLEVQEEDYLNCIVFKKLKKQIEEIGGI